MEGKSPRMFVPHGTEAMRKYRERNKQFQENKKLVDAICDGKYAQAKFYFSENLLKRLQGAIDEGARKGGADIQGHVFGQE